MNFLPQLVVLGVILSNAFDELELFIQVVIKLLQY